MDRREVRIIETYGNRRYKRWEIQEKISYYDNDFVKRYTWKTVYIGLSKKDCIRVLFNIEPKKPPILTLEEAVQLW